MCSRSGWSLTKYSLARFSARRAGFRLDSLPCLSTTTAPLVVALLTTLISLIIGLDTLYETSTPVLPTRLRSLMEVSRPAWRRRRAISTPEKDELEGVGLAAVGGVE